MPTYCYSCECCGSEFDKTLPVSDCKKAVKCSCGGVANRNIVKEHRGFSHIASTWPQYSDAAGVAPDQVKEAYAKSVKDGVPTEFTRDGRAVFTSALHRKQYCESIGLYDRNGGYSDPRRKRIV